MPRFVFRLEPVLGVRSLTEELAQQELASVTARKQACADQLAETRRFLEETLEQDAGAGFDLEADLYLECYREYLEHRGIRQAEDLARCEKEVEKQREQVVEARRERKVLEHLKQKKYLEFRAAETIRETRELDDLGTRAFRFKNVTKGGE